MAGGRLKEPGWRVEPAMTWHSLRLAMRVLRRHCGHDPQSRLPSNPDNGPFSAILLNEPGWRVEPTMTRHSLMPAMTDTGQACHDVGVDLQ